MTHRRAALLAICLLSFAPHGAVAQSVGDAPKKAPAVAELPMIGWRDIADAKLPGPKPGMRKPKDKALLALEKKLAAQRAPAIKLLVGRDFMGLCEVVSATPYRRKVKTMEIVLQGRRSADRGTMVGPLVIDHRLILFQARFIADKEQAKELPVGATLNLSGVIDDVTIEDWQVLFAPFGQRKESTDMIVRVTLKDVDY